MEEEKNVIRIERRVYSARLTYSGCLIRKGTEKSKKPKPFFLFIFRYKLNCTSYTVRFYKSEDVYIFIFKIEKRKEIIVISIWLGT